MALRGDFDGHLYNWLNRVGYTMPARVPVGFGEARSGPSSNRATSRRDRIEFNTREQPTLESLAGRYGRRGPLGDDQQGMLRLLLHEALHQPLMQREPDFYGNATPDMRLWEEAAAEQGARDLLPAAMRQLFGAHFNDRAYQPPTDYRRRVKAYQQLSVFGSGAGKHQDRAARLWRRRFATASTADRQRMMDEANTARANWTPSKARPTRPRAPRPAPSRPMGAPDRPPGY